ncbi:MAG TPA: hypothetical protein VMX97_12315 [Hyphomicrobiaceae bacterium]|nr:hypothetical protein [Hyphomicrobiaceae bacterium]
MNAPDALRITWDQNPAAQEYFSTKKAGDECEGEVKLTVKSIDDEGADLTLEAFIPEGYEEQGDTEESPTPMSMMSSPMTESPNMTPTAMLVRKTKA